MSVDITALEQLPAETEAGMDMMGGCKFTWTGTTSATLCHPDKTTF